MNEGREILLKLRGTTYDAVRYLKQIARESAQHPDIKELARQFCDKPLQDLFNWVHDKVVYYPDPEGQQILRFAPRSLREAIGNCTDYSILISSLLQNMGVDHKFRVVSLNGPRQWEHVYVVTDDGTVLDPVLGQKQDGTDTRENRKGPFFNHEVDFTSKKDFKMARISRFLNGCGCGSSGCRGQLGRSRRARRRIFLPGDEKKRCQDFGTEDSCDNSGSLGGPENCFWLSSTLGCHPGARPRFGQLFSALR